VLELFLAGPVVALNQARDDKKKSRANRYDREEKSDEPPGVFGSRHIPEHALVDSQNCRRNQSDDTDDEQYRQPYERIAEATIWVSSCQVSYSSEKSTRNESAPCE
jgi:hypothetical protein